MLKDFSGKPDFEQLDLVVKMRTLLERFCENARISGTSILPYRDPDLKIFSTLDRKKQQAAYDHFLTYYKVCSSATYENIKLNDDPSLLWWVIKEMGLRPCSDLFDKIQKGNVIEIYSADFIQIYRNFEFFEICSYSLEEIFSYEWRELYTREDNITTRLAERAITVLSGKVTSTVSLSEVGDHYLTEAFSTGRHKILVNHSYLSPLFAQGTGKTEALVVLSNASVVDQKPSITRDLPSDKSHPNQFGSPLG